MRARSPIPQALLSAVLLYAFWVAFGIAAAVGIRALLELLHHSPRLAWLGALALWLSPIPLVAFGHHVLGRILDVAARERDARDASPGLMSWWAGLFAWLAAWLATTTTFFLALVVDPPPPPEPEALWLRALSALSGPSPLLRTIAWIAIAAALYQFEAAVKTRVAASRDT